VGEVGPLILVVRFVPVEDVQDVDAAGIWTRVGRNRVVVGRTELESCCDHMESPVCYCVCQPMDGPRSVEAGVYLAW
jgi:hypothetical protein